MNRVAMMIYLGICITVGGAAFFTRPTSASSNADDGDALMMALGGGGNSRRGPREPADRRSGENTFMGDANFANSGVGAKNLDEEEADSVQNPGDEDEPEILEPVNPNNPINPSSGSKFTDSQMAMFGKLRKKFPGNSLIPSLKTPDEKQAEVDNRREMFAMQSLIAQGNATSEDVTKYYDFQMKTYKDRSELLTHVFKTRGDKMSDEIKEQYEKVNKINAKQLKLLEEQRQRALSRNGG